MDGEMAKATIRSKTGTVITIEGSDSEVSNILSIFERTEAISQAKKRVSRNQAHKKEEKRRASASDMIVDLKEQGYFEEPRTLIEISHALEERGFLYPVTSLSGVVLNLLRKKVLRRKKAEGKWIYGK
jgi:hypothetical protein